MGSRQEHSMKIYGCDTDTFSADLGTLVLVTCRTAAFPLATYPTRADLTVAREESGFGDLALTDRSLRCGEFSVAW